MRDGDEFDVGRLDAELPRAARRAFSGAASASARIGRRLPVRHRRDGVGHARIPQQPTLRVLDQVAVVDEIHRLADIHAGRPARNVAGDAFAAVQDVEPLEPALCADAAPADSDSAANAAMQRPDRFMMARPSSEGRSLPRRRGGATGGRSPGTPSVRDCLRRLGKGRAAETPAALREADPVVLLGGPGDGRRRREGFIGEATDRDRDVIRQGARGPKHRRPAFRAEARVKSKLAGRALEAPRCALDPRPSRRRNRPTGRKTLPVWRWHSLQLQARTRSGSRSTVTRSCPQAQVAMCVIVVLVELRGEKKKGGGGGGGGGASEPCKKRAAGAALYVVKKTPKWASRAYEMQAGEKKTRTLRRIPRSAGLLRALTSAPAASSSSQRP